MQVDSPFGQQVLYYQYGLIVQLVLEIPILHKVPLGSIKKGTEMTQSETRLSANAVGKRLGIAGKTVRKWADKGVFPKPYNLGPLEFWTEGQVTDWENQQNLPADTAAAQ